MKQLLAFSRRRFAIRLEGLPRLLLAVLRVGRDDAYVEVGRHGLRFRLAPLFDLFALRSEIAAYGAIPWPRWSGSGWLLLPEKRIGLIGAKRGVVEVRLAAPRRVYLGLLPWTCERIAVSLEDPAGFLAALRATELEPPVEHAPHRQGAYQTRASAR